MADPKKEPEKADSGNVTVEPGTLHILTIRPESWLAVYERKRARASRIIRSRLKTAKEIVSELRRSHAFNTVSALYGLLVGGYYLALWLRPEIGDAIQKLPKVQPLLSAKSWIILALLIVVLFTIEGAFRAKRRRLKRQADRHRGEIADLQEQVAVLNQRLAAKNLIVSYNGGRYNHAERDGKKILLRVIRLQLENVSERDIEGIKAKAVKFSGINGEIHQVPLRVQHDEHNLKKDGFSLTPGEKEMVDIVERQAGSDEVHLCHQLSREFVTMEKEFKITVVITANGQQKQEKRLRIMLVDNGELLRAQALKS